MADAAYSRRDFAGGAVVTTLSGSINASDTSIAITAATGWPSGTNGEFFVVINKGQSTEEKVRIDTRSGTTLTVTSSGRGVDGTSAAAHAAGESIQLCTTATDLDEANKAVAETVGKVTSAGDLLYGSGANGLSRLAVGASGRFLVSTGSAPAWVAMSGDATINSSGALTIANDAVTAAKIATDAVGSAEIAAGAVGTDELAALSVTTAKLDASSVVTSKISDLNVTTAKINDDAVTTAKILDANVTAAKLAEAARPRYVIGAFTNNFDPDGSVNQYLAYAAGGNTTPPAPCVMLEAGSIIGVTVGLDTARTAGTLVAEVYKNGVATGLSVTIDGSNTQYHYASQAAGTDTFVAGDQLTVRCVTTGFAAAGDMAPYAVAVSIWCQTT